MFEPHPSATGAEHLAYVSHQHVGVPNLEWLRIM